MDFLSTWGLPLIVVGGLAAVTLLFAGVIGRWIDAQSNGVVDPPKERRKTFRGDK